LLFIDSCLAIRIGTIYSIDFVVLDKIFEVASEAFFAKVVATVEIHYLLNWTIHVAYLALEGCLILIHCLNTSLVYLLFD